MFGIVGFVDIAVANKSCNTSWGRSVYLLKCCILGVEEDEELRRRWAEPKMKEAQQRE